MVRWDGSGIRNDAVRRERHHHSGGSVVLFANYPRSAILRPWSGWEVRSSHPFWWNSPPEGERVTLKWENKRSCYDGTTAAGMTTTAPKTMMIPLVAWSHPFDRSAP